MRLAFLMTGLLWAQITIEDADLPSPGRNYEVGSTRPTNSFNFDATGTNFTWNFSMLRADTHLVSEWKGVGSVPQYSFSCGNWQFWQSILLKVADSVPNSPLSIRNVYAFLSKTNTHLRVEGVGLTVNNVPLTFCYQDPDETYVLPLNYGDRDSTTFHLRAQLSTPQGTVTLAQRGYRIHQVDGYGSIQIPLGTYNCLRLKRKNYQRDTVYFNGLPVQRRDTTYYELEWLAKNQGVPLLRVSGNYVSNNFVPAQIIFRDSIQASALPMSESHVAVGPNPTNGILRLPKGEGRYILYDLTGRLFQEGPWPSDGHLRLPEHLPNGIYFLRLQGPRTESYHRLILQR